MGKFYCEMCEFEGEVMKFSTFGIQKLGKYILISVWMYSYISMQWTANEKCISRLAEKNRNHLISKHQKRACTHVY